MKLKDVLNRAINSKNKQVIWNPKKREIKKLGITEEDILNIKIDKNLIGEII